MRAALRLVTTSSDVRRCPKARPLPAQPPNAVEGDAETQLNGRELDADDDQERVAGFAAWHLRVKQPDGFDLDAVERQRQYPGISSIVWVEFDEPAARDGTRV